MNRVTVIVLSNHIDAAPPRVARGLGAATFGVPYQSVFERKPIKVSSEVLQRFAGEYEFDGMRFSLFLRNGELFARVGEAPEVSILFESESAFFVNGMEGTVVAMEDSKGAVTGLSVPCAWFHEEKPASCVDRCLKYWPETGGQLT